MRLFLAPIIVALSATCNFSLAAEQSAGGDSIFDVTGKFSSSFPFAPTAQTTAILQADGTVKVCRAEVDKCETVEVSNKIKVPHSLISGPFVSSAIPSWIAVGAKNTYLCAISKGRLKADCVQLGEYNASDTDLTIKYRSGMPVLTATSLSQSSTYVSGYLLGLKAALQEASEIIKNKAENDGEMTTMEEDIPIVLVPGSPSPDPGPGGIGEVPIGWDPGGTPGEGGGGGGSDECTNGLVADNSYRAASGGFSCPVPKSLLQICLDQVEDEYYNYDVPKCGKKPTSREAAICYTEAADKMAKGMRACNKAWGKG